MLYARNKHYSYIELTIIIGIVSILLAPIHSSPFVPTTPGYFGAYQVRVAYANNSAMSNTNFLPYSVAFSDTPNNLLEISAVLSTYEMRSQPNFLLRITRPVYFLANNTATFSIQITSPSSFGYLRFFVVYNTLSSSNYFEINIMNATCTIANSGYGTYRTQVLAGISRLYVGGADTVNVNPILSSMMLYSYDGATNYNMFFNLNVSSTPITANALSVNLITTAVITEIVVTTFIIKTNLQPIENIFYTDSTILINKGNVSLTAMCSLNFKIPTGNGPQFNRNCSIAMSYLDDTYQLNVFRKTDFDVTASVIAPTITACVNDENPTGVMNIGYTVFCAYTAYCPVATDYFDYGLNISNSSCKPCTNRNANCITCNLTNCFTCGVGWYPSNPGTPPVANCLPCSQTNCTLCLTISTCGQCTNSSYVVNYTCVSCTLITNCTTCTSATNCLVCISGYGPDPTGTCVLCSSMMPQCTKCQNFYICSSCSTSYYLAPGNSSCYACSSSISYCDTCTGSANCLTCLIGYYLAGNTSCVYCGISVSHCISCTAASACTQCQLGYFSPNATTCLACSTLVGCYNCTSATVCVQCNTGYYLLSDACTLCFDPNCIVCSTPGTCDQCNPDFYLTAGNLSCACKQGFSVTNVCTTVIGCVSAVKINNVSTCLFCNSINNFLITGSNCVCKTGYKLTGTQCFTLCGDGLIMGNQQCDDGNTADGDGCSSTCIEQSNYDCNTTLSGYHCVYYANFSIHLEYILRETNNNDNSAWFYFTISPATPNFGEMDLMKYFNLSLPTTEYIINGIYYSNGLISIDLDFTQDIENMDAILSLSFDPNYFNTTNFTYAFLATGTNAPLVISYYQEYTKYLTMFCYVLLGLAALIMLLSIAFQKMIGIETINFIEIIVFSKLIFIQNDLLVATGTTTLKYINGYNEIDSNWSHTHSLPISYRRMAFNSDFILNFQTGLLMMLLSIIILAIFAFYRWRVISSFKQSKKANMDEFKLMHQRLNEKARFIYERVILLVACTTLFDCLASVRVQSRLTTDASHYTYFLLNLTTMIFSLLYIFGILTYQVLNIGKAHQWIAPFCEYSPYYVAYYVCYVIFITPCLVAGQIILGLNAIYALGGAVFINFIVLIIWRPYKQAFHNFCILLNQFAGLLFLAFAALENIITLPNVVQLAASYTILGLILVIEILALVRLAMAQRPPVKEVQRMVRNTDVIKMEEESKSLLDSMEKDFLNRSKRKAKNNSKVNEEDELTRLKNRLKKEFTQNITQNNSLDE